jgi:hypothetical protein
MSVILQAVSTSARGIRRELLATVLAGASGGTEAKWRKLVQIERVRRFKDVQLNQVVEPTGVTEERDGS